MTTGTTVDRRRVTIEPSVALQLTTLESIKGQLEKLIADAEVTQLATLASLVNAAGAGDFVPDQWDLDHVGNGYIERKEPVADLEQEAE